MNVLIIGRGRVGNGLRRALAPTEHQVSAAGRKASRARTVAADVIVLAVPDDEIAPTAARIAPHLGSRPVVLHCAGARGVGELEACRSAGAAVGVMHPLVSFPSKRTNPTLTGATFTVSGAPAAVRASKRLAAACGARVIVAETNDPAYHAAAALTANGAAALAFAAVTVLERLGFERRAAERAVGGLLQTVGANVQTLGVPGALTGPIARGDAETVEKHRRALRRIDRRVLSAYDAVVPVIVQCARAAGLSGERATRILRATKR